MEQTELETSSFQSIEPKTLVEFLASVLEITLGATRHDLEHAGSLLSEARYSDTTQRCTRFASESQEAVIYVQKDLVSQGHNDSPDEPGSILYNYNLASDISSSPSTTASVAFMKGPQPIDPSIPISSQIQLINLPGAASPNDTTNGQAGASILHSFVHLALAPYFDAYTKTQQAGSGSRGRSEIEAKTGVSATKKKLAELELALRHLQENVDIPDLTLPLHPMVQHALDEAAARNGKATVEAIPERLMQDSTFLNSLQSLVNGWIKSIQAITKMSRDPTSGTASQEIQFWLAMESTLENIGAQLASDGVLLTLEILRHAKRFQATLSFTSDTGLKESTDKVQKYNQLMRDFPLDELLSATSLQKVGDALGLIFGHLNKKLRICPYPLMSVADSIWAIWDDNLKEFTNVAREVTRRRNEKFMPIKIIGKHAELQARLKYVSTFRDNHEQLQRTIVNVLAPKAGEDAPDVTANGVVLVEEMGDVDAVEEIKQAWAALNNVDMLDVSPEGTQLWIQAESTYNERTSRVENSIIARLRDRLATAKTASEMFRVFSKFNALFVRPKIRGAITEYQTQLIDNVKHDISSLHERFKQQYGHSEAHAMAQLRDLPPVSGAIIWARQIEKQLNGYMKKVEDVLGTEWALHAEGQKLLSDSNLFRNKLDTRPIFEAWLHDVQRKHVTISAVNFDHQVIALFKETRNLQWLNYPVPHQINNVSKDAKRVYPYATLIARGISLKWESFVHSYDIHIKPTYTKGSIEPTIANRTESKHVQFVREIAASVALLQSKTETLASINATIQKTLAELDKCPYEVAAFQARLETIQMAVDQLNLENYVNLSYWVREMNDRIKVTLLRRLQQAIEVWIDTFESERSDGVNDDSRRKHFSILTESPPENKPSMKRLVHEISMRNQVIYLDPPLEYARASWFSQLHDWLGVVCHLRKVKASRYVMTLGTTNDPEELFTELPRDCADELLRAYTCVEAKLHEISLYVDKWLQFQSLWDLQSDLVYETLGEQLSKWLQLLQEIRKTRSTFDTTEVSRSFGHLTIDYDQVQTKVNAKYDQWQHEILIKFGSRLGNRVREVYAEIEKARRDLEVQSLEASSTAQAVQFITIVQTCKRKVKAWGPEVETFRQGQTTLVRQRYQFPADWLGVEQIDSEWTALNEILARKAKIVEDQTDALRAKITAEDRPVSGTIAPDVASSTLTSFESRITKLHEESEMVARAKEALDLPATADTALVAILEEVQDFKSVWAALSTIWKSLNDLRDMLWTSVQPRKLRSAIDGLIKMTKEMPSRMRQYAAFEHIQNVLRQFLKVNPVVTDLKSEAVRDRHWNKIFKNLKPGKRYSPISMTLGEVWDLNLVATEKIIRDIIAQAQGEMALEEFLKQVREDWSNYSLDLVNYQNKCRLIRGWDDLFAKCSENLNSIQAMKHSPYYKEFEEEAASWEDKLNRVHVLFDVYGSMFNANGFTLKVFSLEMQISSTYSQLSLQDFKTSIRNFFAVMKKVYKQPFVLDVLNISGVQKSLERLAELLNKIQKALATIHYASAKHFKKMFAGLSGLIMDEEHVISGFTSKEGEEVRLKKEISLIKTPKINDWLTLLENSMKSTLAELLSEAVELYEAIFTADDIDQEALNQYISAFPSQIVVLGTQAVWTSCVEKALENGGADLQKLFDQEVKVLRLLASTVLGDLDPIQRKRCYAGRSNLPDNLKKLFRSVAMSKPDKELIAEVMFCAARLSKQAHYDFGLRALKSVLVSSGGLKRARLTNSEGNLGPEEEVEPQIIVQSLRETIAPKLIKSDVDIMRAIEAESFPGVEYVPASLDDLQNAIKSLAKEKNLVVNDTWMTKVLQLYQIQGIHHGVMMVGNSGSGKSVAWKVLLQALQQVENVEGVCHIIDSKVMSKEALYGNLDSTTREWTDGLFTSILRKIVDNLRDPEWVENLNSVLDDNKLLTLPNGERLNLPGNVRIMFEVETLKYATLATVSRCGMVWFSEDTVTPNMMVSNYLETLRSDAFEDLDEDAVATGQSAAQALAIQSQVADLLQTFLTTEDFIINALERAEGFNHIMDYTISRVLNTLFSLLNKAVRDIIEYNSQHVDFPLDPDQVESFIAKKLLLALVWSLTGDCPLGDRKSFGDCLAGLATFGNPILGDNSSLIDFDVTLPQAEWSSWQNQVPSIEVNTHSITQTDVVIPTLDTVRHEDVLYSWLAEHKPLLLCGPLVPEKTMTLFSALRKLPNMEVVGLNFSSATTPDLLIKTFEQYCEYKKTVNGVMLSPTQNWSLACAILPRELTRWVRGIYEAIRPLETLSIEGLVRIWAHEALRLFQDRLVAEDERKWTDDAVHRIATDFFPTIDEEKALGGPILFSNWLSKNYVPVDREQLRDFVKARLKTFCEEEVDVPLILFNDVLEHVLRIDRVFRQPQGHLILIGVSGSGKTTLSRFVAWMNGLRVFQIKVHGKYSAEDFDDDLRDVLRRCGCKGEKICFIMDESNVLDSGFLERMNTLLANAEVPGLFEGDEFASLMTACKEGAQRQGLLLDSQEELYKWFTGQIVKNLHVVFTMNPPEDGLSSKAATSPALFNRCVLNWFGDWSDQALFQVGAELTQSVDLDRPNFTAPDSIPVAYRDLSLPANHRETIINSMVYIHYSLQRFNVKLLKQQGKVTFLTPRHFLDFVAQYVKLYTEKRDDLEEQQRHLNVGLEKLRDTVDKVRDLRVSLADKKGQLERKDAEANEKLQRMVADQREAEQRKTTSLEIQAALEKQEKDVAERREIVLNDLANAEPAVIEAQKSVSNIKRQHLTEVRSMGNPPQGVKLALDSVCTLLGHKIESWKTVQGIIRKDDFIASIVNYDNERQMTKNLRIKMRNEFLSNDDFTYEKVNRASKACGPLVQWVQAQVNYSEILDRVGPLREEVGLLEEQALQTKAEAQAVENTIKTLEQSIATYKIEYAALISETQAIKSEMSKVQFKVDRSVRLLDSLSSERTRWEEGSKSFETQISTLVGDVLVAAAFLAYSGLYDQQYRKNMMEDWLHQLHLSGVNYKQHNPVTEYLSSADERLGWQQDTLPVDDLCTENAIILKRFNRYPLIIDPSGRATEFLQKQSKERKLTVTSFLDDSFTKQLESSLRFGNPILIQDAEYLDPILNHVLNKEYQKTGGRVLIQLGKQEIDFSPAFKIYLSTRDPSATFAPDICSRTTFVNFTVTQSSLQTQSLNDVLKSERPDVDERRSNLIKLQGEFKVHLRQLEKRLLQALNESRGNILDDDNVIETLETLKKEAAEISVKMGNTEGVMAEVDEITLQYDIIARSCSAIFAVLEQLHYLNHFYQFSLQYFLDIFHSVLKGNKRLESETNHDKRRDIIVEDLFVTAYQRTSLGLLQKDKITLAMLLAQAAPYKMDKSLIDVILDETVVGTDLSTDGEKKDEVMGNAIKLPAFKGKLEGISSATWDRFLSEELAENFVPQVWDDTVEKRDQELISLLLIKLFRLDRFVPAAERFVTAVFGPGLLDVTEDLKHIVEQVSASRPIALCSSPGFDASYKVENLVEQSRAACTNIAMGSNEGLATADKAISNAAANGSWVLVKNVHLAPTWLQSLEKRMDSLKPHANFRLFLSMESSPKIPVNLLRASRVLMYEQPAGVRANMKDSMTSLSTRGTKTPVERTRLYLLLSFLHAVVQERLRYAPNLGWKGFWEFNDSDYECSAYIIDTWVETVAAGRSNVAPQNLPWDILRTLIVETYGGKIDDEEDFSLLTQLVHSFMTPAAYDIGHSGTTMKDFMDWVKKLPEREPPTYLGLPANAEKLLLVGQGRSMIQNLGKITEMLDEGEQIMAEAV
ncbi:hypothetical protein DID88_005301 [Monilinia fructigena]|uniref:Dynein heavy chain, cytoplasmic n=1 Tax=Monilinia fructigena TaxID=38457 RepID=A0A395J4R1_9HELO|nr:hypothetical protein DID88_005301 [Monilinia fructigena]